MRFVYSLSASLFATLLHIGCCLLPFFSIIPASVAHTNLLGNYQPVFTLLQWCVLLWLSGRILAHHLFGATFHSRLEMLSFYVGLVITVMGLVVGYRQPFKTEEQVLAEQHFERFRQSRQLSIHFLEHSGEEQLRNDLSDIEGIRKSSIKVSMPAVSLSYEKSRITPDEIYQVLKNKGYKVQ